MPRLLVKSLRRLACDAFAASLILFAAATARAETSSYPPAAAQPTVPASNRITPTSPVVESLIDDGSLVLDVHKAAHRSHFRHDIRTKHRAVVRYRAAPIERPTLAGVELLRPLPRPGQPPHIAVPLPAYALDSIVAAATMPPPPIVCHPVRHNPDLPDPRLYRERTVVCEVDNP